MHISVEFALSAGDTLRRPSQCVLQTTEPRAQIEERPRAKMADDFTDDATWRSQCCFSFAELSERQAVYLPST